MERIEVLATTSGAEDLAYVEAAAFIDGEAAPELIAELRGDLFADRRLHVGFIESASASRRTGVASRLLLHTIRVLGVKRITADTIDGVADAFFDRMRDLLVGEVEVEVS